MIALMQEIRLHPVIPLHGPEHHALVPAVILATYRNRGGEVSPALLCAALERGKQITGGFCGLMGACGAALGVGIAFSLLLDANPLKPKPRQIAQTATQAVLQELASLEAGRCCQRDTWLALTKAAELSRELLPITLLAEAPLRCGQAKDNKECLGETCPLYKFNS
jgi:hypothetical protein